MSCLVDNTGVRNLIKHMVSTTSLYEIHLCKLILLSLHKFLCSMEDNPFMVDMCLVVEPISSLTPSHSRCLGTSSVYYTSDIHSNIVIMIIHHLVHIVLCLVLLDLGYILP